MKLTWPKTLLALLALGVVWESLFRATGPESLYLYKITDIKSPDILVTKINSLAKTPKKKIVFFGDSLIFGNTLQKFGDEKWRENSISNQIRLGIDRDLYEMVNLGINGALPADLERMVELVDPIRPEVIVIDFGLRSLSKDFWEEKVRFSRPWLADMSVQENRVAYRPQQRGEKVDYRLSSLISSVSSLFRMRAFVQDGWFDGGPKDFLERTRNGIIYSHPDEFMNPMVTLLKAKKRYAGIVLNDKNPQLEAVRKILARFRDRGQKAIVFFARENPSLRPSMIEGEKYKEIISQFEETIRDGLSDKQVFIPPIEELEAKYYLDQIHVDAEGNRIITEKIRQALQPML